MSGGDCSTVAQSAGRVITVEVLIGTCVIQSGAGSGTQDWPCAASGTPAARTSVQILLRGTAAMRQKYPVRAAPPARGHAPTGLGHGQFFTLTVIGAEVVRLPAASRAIAVKVNVPFGTDLVCAVTA